MSFCDGWFGLGKGKKIRNNSERARLLLVGDSEVLIWITEFKCYYGGRIREIICI
jgi:hypothetical protein